MNEDLIIQVVKAHADTISAAIDRVGEALERINNSMEELGCKLEDLDGIEQALSGRYGAGLPGVHEELDKLSRVHEDMRRAIDSGFTSLIRER